MTYDSGRTPGADFGRSGDAGAVVAGFELLGCDVLAASCEIARLVKIASSSVHFSNRTARFSTPLLFKCIQVTFVVFDQSLTPLFLLRCAMKRARVAGEFPLPLAYTAA